MTQNDFNLLKSQGVKAICIKLTEGTSYQNPYAASHIKMSRNAGLAVSAYHYSKFSSNAQAIAEANYFAQRANALGLPKGTLMVNDAEDGSMVPNNNVDPTTTSNAFAQQLKNNGFINVLHYARDSWVGVGSSMLLEYNKMGGIDNFWIAQYDYAKPSESNLKWQDKGGAWQYSSNMVLAGGSTQNSLDVSIDYKGRFTGSGVSKAGEAVMYRMYNPNSGEHFYTANSFEKDSLTKSGWKYEGIGWYAPTKSNAPVYRMYNPNAGDHHYTLSAYEKDSLVKAGWRYEGIGWYSSETKALKIYRAYNANAKAGSHNYTANSWEQKNLVNVGWKDEGIAWYGSTPAP